MCPAWVLHHLLLLPFRDPRQLNVVRNVFVLRLALPDISLKCTMEIGSPRSRCSLQKLEVHGFMTDMVGVKFESLDGQLAAALCDVRCTHVVRFSSLITPLVGFGSTMPIVLPRQCSWRLPLARSTSTPSGPATTSTNCYGGRAGIASVLLDGEETFQIPLMLPALRPAVFPRSAWSPGVLKGTTLFPES
jgi:hypothetical protein